MIQTFVKNRVIVEAIQFTDELKDRVYSWARDIQYNVYHDWDDKNRPILKIPTLEGYMICSIGDYLIKEPFPTYFRKLYPCKADIFEKTYSKATSEHDMETLFKEIIAWQDSVFTKATPLSCVTHLEEEVRELKEKTEIGEIGKEEIADNFFLLFAYCNKAGISYDQILQCIADKFAINKRRKWGDVNEKGYVKHIDE